MRDRVGRGIALAALAFALFAVHDASNKWLVATIPVWQILFVRSAVVALGCLAIGGKSLVRRVATTPLRAALAGRAALTLVAWLAFYWSARSLPLAQLLTLYFSSPVITALLGIRLLGERIDRSRWISVLLGFAGVVIAADPSGVRISGPTLLVLGAAATWAYAVILMRRIARQESTMVQMLAQNLFFTVVTGLASSMTWVPPRGVQWSLLLLVGVLGGGGQYLLFEAARFAPAVIVATVEYSSLIWAFVLGFLIFGDVPRPAVWTGAAMILASGAFMLWHERRTVFRED